MKSVGRGLGRHFPLLPSVRDDRVTCLRACADRTDSELAGQ